MTRLNCGYVWEPGHKRLDTARVERASSTTLESILIR